MATKPKKPEVAPSAKIANTEKNRMMRLERTLKKQPANEQVVLAMKTTRLPRKKPKNPVWSSYWISVAKSFVYFSTKFDPKVMSSNPKVAAEALGGGRLEFKVANNMPKNPFSLGQRAKNKYGEYVWS